jgi:hypothetical protein
MFTDFPIQCNQYFTARARFSNEPLFHLPNLANFDDTADMLFFSACICVEDNEVVINIYTFKSRSPIATFHKLPK